MRGLPLVFRVLLIGLLCGGPVVAMDGGLIRRSRVVCQSQHVQQVVAAPVVVADHAQALIAQPVVAVPQIHNHYPAAPLGLGSTVYGYAAPQQLAFNPYQIDPAAILREAARLNDGAQQLSRESLQVYERLGTDALGLNAQTQQLLARAALIEATKPEALAAAVTQSQSQSNAQRLSSGNATICIKPDGAGGFTISVEQPQSQTGTTQATQSPSGSAQHSGIQVLATRCASCHTAGSEKGNLALFTDANTLAEINEELAAKILKEVQDGAMPPAQNAAGDRIEPLTANELVQLQALLGG